MPKALATQPCTAPKVFVPAPQVSLTVFGVPASVGDEVTETLESHLNPLFLSCESQRHEASWNSGPYFRALSVQSPQS